MLCIMQALCNFTSRVLATSEVSILSQRQIENVVEKTRLYFRKTVMLNMQRKEGISATDFITDEVY